MLTAVDLITEKVKPWMRHGYLEWRREYESSDKFKEKLSAHRKKRRQDPSYKALCAEYLRRYQSKHKLRSLVKRAIKRAEKRGIEYDKTFLSTLMELRPDRCACCAVLFDYSSFGYKNQARQAGPTLDRIDVARGYVAGNVGIICWRCNRIKSDALLKEIKSIVAYMEREQ